MRYFINTFFTNRNALVKLCNQKRLIICSVLCLTSLLFSLPTLLTAEQEKEKERNLPKSGVLSGTYRGGNEGVAVDGPWGKEDTDIFSEESSPITGSVSKIAARKSQIKVFNNSEDRYSISVRIVEYDVNKKQVNSFTRSYTMDANSNKTEEFTPRFNTDQSELQLVSWRNLTPKSKETKEQKNEEFEIVE